MGESIYDLKLNEVAEVEKDSCWVRRVPGGWIYEYEGEGYTVAAVFVPFVEMRVEDKT